MDKHFWNEIAACVVFVATLVFGFMRFAMPSHGLNFDDVFKDVAHVFVGGLFGAYLYGWACSGSWWPDAPPGQRLLGSLAIGLTVLEVVATLVK